MSWLKCLFKNEPEPQGAALQQHIGYAFKNPELLIQSLTHPSLSGSKANGQKASPEGPVLNNQRLEFLGDSVLALILAKTLYDYFPEEREGVLAQCRSALGQGTLLAQIAQELGLAKHLRMSPTEEQAGGRHRKATLEDALEALVGAIYLDSDLATVTQCVLNWYGPLENRLGSIMGGYNPKGQLQEVLHNEMEGTPTVNYSLTEAEGPAHSRLFKVELHINGALFGTGSGPTKKNAEEAAAREALERLNALKKNATHPPRR